MKTKRILQAGQPGTKKLVERYGDNLICVRQRYDDKKNTMYKTIEIIIEEKTLKESDIKISGNKIMDIRIGYNEVDLRKSVKNCGGKWNPQRKLWQLSFKKVKELDLLARIVDYEPSKKRLI